MRAGRVVRAAGCTAEGQNRMVPKMAAGPWSPLDSLKEGPPPVLSADLSSSLVGRLCEGPTTRGCSCLLSCHWVVLSVTMAHKGGP